MFAIFIPMDFSTLTKMAFIFFYKISFPQTISFICAFVQMTSVGITPEAADSAFNRNVAFAVTFLAGGLAIGYLLGRRSALPQIVARCATTPSPKPVNVTRLQQPEKEKVVDTYDMEDIGAKKVFCRCWRSKKFPYCDGTHNEHNKETGDNVGPLIIQKEKKTAA